MHADATGATPPKLAGRQSVQFYIADGRFRMQVFAVEELDDGNLTVYCSDVLEEALAAKLLGLSHAAEPPFYGAGDDQLLRVEPFNGTVINPAAQFKDMVGWNRKAIRITLPESASTAQLDATEILWAMAARHFSRPASAKGA